MKKTLIALTLGISMLSVTAIPIYAEPTQETQTEVHHDEGYDPEHPLAGKIDEWDLRLSNDTYSLYYVCSINVQAMLTNQMDIYYAPPVGESVDQYGNRIYVTQEDYDYQRMTEQALYNWFCDWLGSIDFLNMSETNRAKEIQKILAQCSYDSSYKQEYSRNDYYTVLIEKKGICGEFTMTASSLAKAMGLECAIKGFGNHAYYFIKADGYWYEGSNNSLNMSTAFTEAEMHNR